MPQLYRVKSRWTGFSGAPGYSVMHFRDFNTPDPGAGDGTVEDATAAVQRVQQFFSALAVAIPDEVSIDVEREVDVIDDSTGELVNSLQSTQGGIIDGTAGGSYLAPAGAVVNWRTGGIRNGRRIRGRTFLVPLAASNFNAQGQLIPAVQNVIQTAASALAANTGSPDLFVFARPTAPAASDGTSSVVTGATVPQMAAILRSRRD